MIIKKTPREIEIMKVAGEIVALCHAELASKLKVGITTKELDVIAEKFIRSKGATPSFKGYHGFPYSICISINEEVVHGMPSKRKIKDGDLVSIDIGALYKGYHGDSAWTYAVGNITDKQKHLMKVTEESLYIGLKQVKPGNRIGDISHAIQTYAEANGLSVVRELTGHGIGQDLHEQPTIPNYGAPDRGPKLKEGMTLAIEPMLNLGVKNVVVLEDDWTVVTTDNKYSAHYEHTVVVTNDGYEILTKEKEMH